LGAGAIVAFVSNRLIGCILLSFIGLFMLFLYRNLLRREWAAAVVFVLLPSLGAAASQAWPLPLLLALIFYSGTVLVLTRLGLLASVSSAVFRLGFLDGIPLTTHGSVWYAGISLAGILLMAAMVFYAFYTSLGGRPVFGSEVLDE
jgi:predicted membrane-bound mannosyltransferase